MTMTGFSKSAVLVVIGLSIGVALTLGIIYGPISERQGGSNSYCEKFNEPSVPSGKGATVSSHTTACTTVGTSIVSYVYVHPSDKIPTAEHLIFVYSQSNSDQALKAEWLDDRNVILQVNQVGQISKIRTTSDGVLIAYKINGR